MPRSDIDAEEPVSVQVDAVLPPDEGRGAESSVTESIKKVYPRAIARVLDDLLTIPNSKVRIGLDPIIGFLFPAVGDAITATLGTTILLEGARRRLPKRVLARMATNIVINAAMGSVPLLGDAFSIWFKSNAQNNALLERHSGNLDQPRVRPNLWLVLIFLLAVFGIIALMIFGMISLGRWLF